MLPKKIEAGYAIDKHNKNIGAKWKAIEEEVFTEFEHMIDEHDIAEDTIVIDYQFEIQHIEKLAWMRLNKPAVAFAKSITCRPEDVETLHHIHGEVQNRYTKQYNGSPVFVRFKMRVRNEEV